MENEQKAPPPEHCGASRQNAWNVLDDKIRRYDRKNAALRVLRDIIPWDDVSKEQEESLWILFCEL